jgi:imidazolonepropionase-like amidohydrolase
MLRDAGIEFAISVDQFWQVRNLPFQAGTAGGNGLTREQMLQSVCSTPAKILGIYDRAGSLENGKDATLVISTGDLFDMRTSKVEAAFINGRQIDLDNIQSQLNRKYRTKYGLNQ